MDHKVWVTPFGGHGTSAIRSIWGRRNWPFYARPDYIFSPAIETYDLYSIPVWDEKFKHYQKSGQLLYHRGKEWVRRAGFEPLPGTIYENLEELVNITPFDILLFGKCSLSEPFLTNVGIKNGLYIVRHPLDAYDSLYGRQHPQWCKVRGGIQSILNVEHYCEQWNKVVYDMLCSHHTYGNPIIRYETLAKDLENADMYPLSALLGGIWYNKPKREFTTPKIEEYMRQMTKEYFDELYNQW